MIRTLVLAGWEKGFVTYQGKGYSKRLAVRFAPGARRKIALIVHANERKSFFLHDRTRRLWRRTDNVYTLRRMLRHMLDGYDAVEMPRLQKLLSELRAFDPKIGVLSTMPKDAVEQLRDAIGDAVMELDFAQNFWKVEARDQLEWVLVLRDANGRLNIAVLCCRNTTAREHLERRMEEILGIRAWASHYLGIVERLVWGLEYLVQSTMQELDAMVWKNEPVILARLTHAVHDVQQLSLPPFRFVSHAAREELLQASVSTKEKEARQLIRRAWEGLAMKSVRARLEQMLLDNAFTVRELMRVHNALSPRRITERGFQYPGMRQQAQIALFTAIRVLRDDKNREEARKQIKEATVHL